MSPLSASLRTPIAGLLLVFTFSIPAIAQEAGTSEQSGKAALLEPAEQPLPDRDTMIPQEPVVEAENIDLSQPVAPPQQVSDFPTQVGTQVETKSSPDVQSSEEASTSGPKAGSSSVLIAPGETAQKGPKPLQPLLLLGKSILPGTTTRLAWSPDQTFEGLASPTPVLVAHGAEPGPKMCLTAAVHGDELIGIEIVRRVLYSINAKELRGTVIGVPIVNLQGFRRSSRYLVDRRDLNRFFPGSKKGSSASRIAHSFFNNVITHCDYLVDLHTGSFYRTNLPQLRADLHDSKVRKLTRAFDGIAVLHSDGAKGTLRRAAVNAGIPAVTLEAGGPMELNEHYVSQGVKSVNTLLDKLGMLNTLSFWGAPSPAYYDSVWVRADQGGILFSDIKLGARVRKGHVLGHVTDPITNMRSPISSPVNGRVIGMAVNQVVFPGFAAYHIGIESGSSPATQEKMDEIESTRDIDEEEESGADSFD